MPKTKTQWVCQNCGRVTLREMGKCPQCGEFNSMLEVVVTEPSKRDERRSVVTTSRPLKLSEIEGDDDARLNLPIEEFARVLGGGIVPGSVVLVGGDPGIGKSTLLLQLANVMAETAGSVLYVSGEESARQIKMRALRLAQPPEGSKSSGGFSEKLSENLYLLTETNLDALLTHVDAVNPKVLIVDSIQTIYSGDISSAAGSVSQVRECAQRLTSVAKGSDMAVFLIGHVTKEGAIAGPRVLEHIVDTVLYLEGDRYQSYRLLRGVKNRFGTTMEVGVFEMRGAGMVEVLNPSEAFLAERMVNAPGSAIAVTMEGTRPILVEVQALANPSPFGNPRRTANGVDFNRLLLTTAVLTRRIGLKLFEQDIFVNVVGGLQVEEPAADLAVAAAIASSVRDRAVPADMAFVGEVGLSGELRAVSQINVRLREAAKLGFKKVLIPKTVKRNEPFPTGIEILQARSVHEALDLIGLSKSS
ncbi:MAG: DNA repair protein RadA [Chloroflexi bacterium]|nr:DNA repair protein RadA [Chloroflexota bacterium]